MKLSLIIFLMLLANAISAFGQAESCRKSTEGKDFWFGFMESRNYQTGHYNEITLSSINTCKFDIFIGKSTIPYTSGTVMPNIPLKVTIDWRLVEATGSEVIQAKAIHLVSDNPLNVYALNWSPNSADVAMIFPKESLGNEYYAMCYTPHINGNGINSGNGRNSEFLIVASEDNTIVRFTPSKVTDKGKTANVSYQVVLNKGELYQVQSENLPTPKYPGQGDLTGSYISSDKPVAFYSGSLSTTVPGDASVSAWDHLYEQIPPLKTWGRKFIAVPLKTRHEDSYRVLASEDNTTIRIGNKTPVVLNKGKFYEFMLLSTEPSLIESDKPVLLAQYSNSNSVDKQYNGGDGDPFMVIVSPVNQTREKVSFVAYDSQQITNKYFINVIVKDDAVGKIKLDNNIISFNSLSGTGYSYAQVNLITKGNHIIESTETGKGFIAYVYGFGGVESYGYGVGYNLDIVLDLGSNLNVTDGKVLIRCDGTDPLTLNAGNGFDSYFWSTGATTSSISVTEEGTYSVTASTVEGCVLTDVIRLQASKPTVDLGPDILICNPDTAILDASDQFNSYLWSTIQTERKITISKSGKYSVEVTDKYGCKAKDEIVATFIDKPTIDLKSLEKVICGDAKKTQVNIKTNATSYSLESVDLKATVNGLSVNVPDFGIYPMIFKANHQYCPNVANFDLAFYPTPSVNLGRDTTICNPGSIELKAGDQFAKYLWSTKDTTKSIIVKQVGLYNVNVTDKNGCKTSDEIKINFTDKPKLDLSRLQTLMCGKFSTTVDISADKNVTWLLGSSNFNVSIDGLTVSVSPADFGIYPVTLTAKDEFNCSTSATVNLGFYKSPVVDLGSDSIICNPESVELKAGDQFAKYLWSTKDTTKSIVVKQVGLYSVNVTDKNGCKTSDEIKINFTDKPKLDLSRLETMMCGKFSTTLDVSADKNVTWLLESKNPKVSINDLMVSVSPSDFGTYPITLTAKDEFSCSASTVINLGFNKIPIVDLGPDSTICDPEGVELKAGDQFTKYLWSTKETTKSIIVKQAGIYSVNVTDKYGCKGGDDIKILFAGKPKLDLSRLETLICGDFSTTLDVSADKNVTWLLESNNPKVIIDDLTVSVAPADFGIYPITITAKDESSCSASSTVNLEFFQTPKVDLGSDTAICSQDNFELIAGDQFVRYLWSTKDTTKSIMVKEDGIYSINVIDKNGCKSSDAIKIIFNRKPRLDLSRLDTLYCGKFTATLDITADKNVTWLLESNNPKIKIDNLTVSVAPEDYGIYPVTLTAKDEFSCTASAAFKLGFYPTPDVKLGLDSAICGQEYVEIFAGSQFVNYLWSTNDTTKSIIAKKDGIYSVGVTDKNGCKASDSIEISFNSKPRLDFSRLDTLYCGKFAAALDISADKKVTWLLESNNPKITFKGLNVSVSPADFGIYPVTLTAKDEFSCSESATFNLRFFQKPVVDLGPDSALCNRQNVVLKAGDIFANYFWSTSDTTNNIIVKNDGIYSVRITDKNGCEANDSIKISFGSTPRLDLSRLDTLFCGKLAATLDISADKKVTWLLESDNPKIAINGLSVSVSPGDFGIYPVTLTAKDEFSCSAAASFNLGFFQSPVVNLGSDTTLCNRQNVVLKAGDHFTHYLWSTNETTNNIIVKNDGNYSVRITDINGCKTSDSIKIFFNSKPQLDLSGIDTLICGKLSDILNVTSDIGSIAIQRLSDNFIFNDLNITVPDFGTYKFKIKAIDGFSCSSDSVIEIGFHKTPTVDLSIDSTNCYRYNLNVRYLGNAKVDVSDFIWVFGGDTINHGVGNNAIIVPLGINLNTRDLKLKVIEQGCSNEKTLDDIRVTPNLKLSVLDSLGCEPFTAKFMADNSETVTYIWDFGDGSILSGEVAEPSHTYKNTGYYDVKLKVTTSKGCTNEIRVDSMIFAAPVPTAGFTLSPDNCLIPGTNEISYSGSGNIRDKYYWDIKSFDLSEIIIDPKESKGPFRFDLKTKPTAFIGLKVISEFGCESLPAGIKIKRKPDFSINSSSNAGCTPFDPLFTAKTSDPVDKVNYSWDFGDGTKGTGDQVKHEYNEADQKYDVVLSAISLSTGCADTISRKDYIWAYPKPTVGFSTLPDGCLEKGNHEISYNGTGDQLDIYVWNLSSFDTEEIIQNPNKTQGPLIFNLKNKPQVNIGLKVISQYGCLSDSALIVVKRKPDFSISSSLNAGCAPFEPTFTAKTGDSVDQVNYSWDFGDGVNGSGDQVKHTYSEPDHKYDLILSALSSTTGCYDTLFRENFVWVYPKPTAGFSISPDECLEKGNHEISYKGTGNNLDTYIWDLKWFDNEEIIQNPFQTQGPLIFNLKNKPQANIGLKVISKYGCQSDSISILVKRKPDFSMISSMDAGCAPLEPIFTAKTNDPVDQVKFNWNFGDGRKGSGDQVKHEYGDPDHKYDVLLSAISSTTGCRDTLFRKNFIWVFPKPLASFSMDNKVVYNDKPTVNFSNSSTGANTYSWNFGDGLTSDLKDPSHYYKVTGHRTVLLEVFNDLLCSDTISHQLLVAFFLQMHFRQMLQMRSIVNLNFTPKVLIQRVIT